MVYLKLRSNIKIKDDIELAKHEISTMFGEVATISSPKYFEKAGIPVINTRSDDPLGFTCKDPKNSLYDVLRSLNFIQEVWVKKEDPILLDFPDKNLGYQNGKYWLFIPFMAATEILEKTYNGKFSENNFSNLISFLAGGKITTSHIYDSAVNLQTSSTQHVHGLHKYKAKFFPRFVRSLIVTYINKAPKNKNNERTILDPFVGSGTALVEASILGYRSFGIDIDKLSCEISKAKIAIMDLKYSVALEYINEINKLLKLFSSKLNGSAVCKYKFPRVIASKFDRWNATDEKVKYESEISSILDLHSKGAALNLGTIFA